MDNIGNIIGHDNAEMSKFREIYCPVSVRGICVYFEIRMINNG